MKKYILPILLMSLLYWSCEEEKEVCIEDYGVPNFRNITETDSVGYVIANNDNGTISGGCLENEEFLDDTTILLSNSYLGKAYPNPTRGSQAIGFSHGNYNTPLSLYILNEFCDTTLVLLDSVVLNAGMHQVTYNVAEHNTLLDNGFYRVIIDFGDKECFQNIAINSNVPDDSN